MKKVALILLSVTLLLVSCAKQTTVTTEQTDSYTENLTEPTATESEPVTWVTDPTAEPSEAPSEEPTGATDGADTDEFYEGGKRIIGEYATIEEAFAGYEIRRNADMVGENGWDEFEKENPAGTRLALYVDDNPEVGFMVEIVDWVNGEKRSQVIQVYAFGKLYDYSDETNLFPYGGWEHFGTEWKVFSATEDMLIVNRWYDFTCYYAGGVIRFDYQYDDYPPDTAFENKYCYNAYVDEGVVRYEKGRWMMMSHELFGWASSCWYPGLCEEHGAEMGMITIVDGEVKLVPDEVYTVGDIVLYLWPNFSNHNHAFYDEYVASGCETVDEFVGKYFITDEGVRKLVELRQ